MRKSINILMADDDADDRLMTQEALSENFILNRVDFVVNGEELLYFLRNEGPYADAQAFPKPGLILLDLNMPRMDGREALEEIKKDERLRDIPIVILTTSSSPEDINRVYQLGGASFITKPVSFEGLVEVMRSLGNYWFDIVELPGK